MNRFIIKAEDGFVKAEVGTGWRDWNNAINAHTGCIVPLSDGSELWCDEEALCKNNPVRNAMASLLAKQDIYGDVILFKKGDIK